MSCRALSILVIISREVANAPKNPRVSYNKAFDSSAAITKRHLPVAGAGPFNDFNGPRSIESGAASAVL